MHRADSRTPPYHIPKWVILSLMVIKDNPDKAFHKQIDHVLSHFLTILPSNEVLLCCLMMLYSCVASSSSKGTPDQELILWCCSFREISFQVTNPWVANSKDGNIEMQLHIFLSSPSTFPYMFNNKNFTFCLSSPWTFPDMLMIWTPPDNVMLNVYHLGAAEILAHENIVVCNTKHR